MPLLRRVLSKLGWLPTTPLEDFHSPHYLRHTQRRLEHLASLPLRVFGRTVLEVGAGVGDHTSFFLDRGCRVLSTDPRAENIEILKATYPSLPTLSLDLNAPPHSLPERFDIVYCYGVLYHLSRPAEAIRFMAEHCKSMLLMETCVSMSREDLLGPCSEKADCPSQSITGTGCRPSRSWVLRELKLHFEFVYFPVTQPCHEEFPLDWSRPLESKVLTRSIFIASREAMRSELLADVLPELQRRH
jgi:SAM-dependent methyltransferase